MHNTSGISGISTTLTFRSNSWAIPTQASPNSHYLGNSIGNHHITQASLQSLTNTIHAFHTTCHLIDYTAFLIRLSQGPVKRRIDIRWWNQSNIRTPQLIRWTSNKHAKPLKRIDHETLSHSTTPDMTPHLQALLTLYPTIKNTWDSLLKASRLLSSSMSISRLQFPHTIPSIEGQLELIHKQITRTLTQRNTPPEPTFHYNNVCKPLHPEPM